jgi:hypothetical protein
MSRLRTLLSLSALFAVLGALFVATPPSGPAPAFAADCGPEETGTLVIRIIDVATGDPFEVDGTEVLIDPDPADFKLDKIVTDTAISDAGALEDKDQDSGVIRVEGACSTEGGEEYSAAIYHVPSGPDEDCDGVDSFAETQLEPEETEVLELSVTCVSLTPTAIPSATSTPNPASAASAASVLVSVAAPSVNCGATTLVAVQVRDAAGNPVKAGVPVSVMTNLGSISPASGKVTDGNGFASVTYVAPADGGTATIVATAGTASDTAQVGVSCISDVLSSGSQTAPPGSIIRPPNTGSGGLVGEE